MTVIEIMDRKIKGPSITMVTAYSAMEARLLSRTGIDIALVGDSLGNIVQGHDSTLPVTTEELLYHTRCVRRGLDGPFLVSDMPFLSYNTSRKDGIINAGKMIKEGGANAVKLEGGAEIASLVRAMTRAMIPVMGHVGLKPQAINMTGGYKVQGKDLQGARQVIADSIAIERAGAFALVLEGIPPDLAKEVTSRLHIPTIGIGAGVHVDGQVLVFHDLVGWSDRPLPRFVRPFGSVGEEAEKALLAFSETVRNRSFPSGDESYPETGIPPEEMSFDKSREDKGRS
ncbi:MAG: 3-methyl-2-oxobutanoate hydroxymethyltransferase, partial [Nitrospiraceae bacterium]|nr:3-methyl-2-oxobutanoate hydroxymethyltransferase [Nitrospiraceae bacterium]